MDFTEVNSYKNLFVHLKKVNARRKTYIGIRVHSLFSKRFQIRHPFRPDRGMIISEFKKLSLRSAARIRGSRCEYANGPP